MAEGNRFGGRTAIVTGAASGIGRATALRLARDGAAIGCLDLSDDVERTAEEIRELGGLAVAAPVDVVDRSSISDAVAAVESRFGPTRVLANVAGVLRFAHSTELSEPDWDLVIDVNLKGTFQMCRAVIPSMLGAGGGAIVNVSSTAGVFGQAYVAAYAAAKGGVAMLTRSLAWEYLKHDIRVNAIAPGGVETPMTNHVDFPDGMDFGLIQKTMAVDNRMIPPEQPAALISFLASEECDGINGAVIPIDHAVTA